MASQFKRRSRRIVGAVMGTPWMMEESALAQIVDFLSQRSRGVEFSRDEIVRRLEESNHGRGVIKALGLNFDPQDDEDFYGPCVVDGGIAILPMTGVLAPRLSWMEELSGGTSTELYSVWYQEALSDKRVNAILAKIDSPGGSATGNEELSAMLYQTRGQKPCIAVAQGMVASAAYYNGRAFQKLMASPSTEVGSVGCYMIHGETSQADEDAGVKYTVIKAGENKASGNSVEPLNAKSKGVLQARIDAFYDQFVGAVATYAGKTVAQVEAAFGQGTVVIAEQALAAGMIDGVATFEDVLGELQDKFQSTKPTRGAASITGKPRVLEETASRSDAATLPAREGQHMPKVKAALLKMGLIDENSNDGEIRAAVRTFCKMKAKDVPKEEDEIVKLLEATEGAQRTEGTTVQTVEPTRAIATRMTDDQVRLAERNRVENIRSSGTLLQMGDDAITAAINSNEETDTILTSWRTTKAGKEGAVTKVEPKQQTEEKVGAACFLALQHRSGVKDVKLTDHARAFLQENHSLLDMGKACLKETGARFIGDQEDIAKAILGSGAFGELRVIRGESSGYQRPGDFPGILSALMGKLLDQAEELTGATFRLWTDQIQSVPDFKPKTIHAVGEFGELPEHEDAEVFVESATTEEASWIQVDEYGDNWSLTPRMVLDDDLQALQDVAEGKQTAHDMTIERLCCNLLTGNANAQDANPLFGTTRTNAQAVTMPNDITSGNGGAPSTTQLALMRQYLRKIYGISGKFKLNQTLARLLITENQETATEQLLQSNLPVVPITETTGQIFRGRVQWTVVPMLSEVVSSTMYYGISNSRRKAIVFAFQRGFENMRTLSYYDPRTDCRVWNFKGRFAAAVRTWRTIIRNYGA